MRTAARESAARWGFLVPAVGLVVAIALGPMLFTLWLSFRRQIFYLGAVYRFRP